NEESSVYVKFELNFYVDDIRLEDGKRGSRLGSQIYQEIVRYFKKTYPTWRRKEEPKSPVEAIAETENKMAINIAKS
ncbi:MAG: hypothetical protein AB4372_09800, partial [Xenococcus sp. (in: cyanobacteria)]